MTTKLTGDSFRDVSLIMIMIMIMTTRLTGDYFRDVSLIMLNCLNLGESSSWSCQHSHPLRGRHSAQAAGHGNGFKA